MRIIDLTHPISEDMPVYPGTEPPILRTEYSIKDVGFTEKKITFFSHTGTHIDAPAHIIEGEKTLDQLLVDHFYGNALIINCETINKKTIDIEEIASYEEKIEMVDFCLIHTGWSQYWGNDKYFTNYQVLSLEAANWLSKFNLKGIGFDTISADKSDSKNFPIHKTFLRKNIIIIENLKNLTNLPKDQIVFSCFPLSFNDADGSPVRAVALFE